jgi:(p)ppGpp synthase/HD superfamily hydrolase
MAETTRKMGRALTYADELHKTQLRKGTEIPYLSHLLGVTSLVLEEGGSEDEAIAALFHDAAEDQGGEETLAEIRQRFGPAVAEIVRACSDTLVGDRARKPPWRERKETYLAHLGATENSSALRVSLADKLHNARSILRDLRDPAVGASVFERFSTTRSETLWYYRALADAFVRLQPDWPMAREFARTVEEIERTAAGGD